MNLKTRPLLLAALTWTAACGGDAPTREWTPADHGQPRVEPGADQGRAAPDEGTEDPNARAARALWNATCAGCHGRDARGHGEAAPPVAKMPDMTLAAFQSSRSDEQLAQVIRDGRGMMPGFGKQVNPQGIAALIQHIRTLGTAAANPPANPDAVAPAQPPDTAPAN